MGLGFCLRAMAILVFEVLKLPLAIMRVKESALQSILTYYQSL